jgi:uncharacterized membrane protein
MVSDTVQDVNQVLHNVGMAAWVGGSLFGRVALNPSLSAISSPAERGAVANKAWNAYNAVNAASLAAVGLGHVGGRMTELRLSNLSERERPAVRTMDVCTAAGVITGVLSMVQGVRLARQAPGGAVPVDTGTEPAQTTPPQAARIQRSLALLGVLNVASGVGLVAATGLYWRSAASRPPLSRALRRRASR